MSGWIAVDLDETLAEYSHKQSMSEIGKPIPKMVARIKNWLTQGIEVRIFTARASIPELIPPIEAWCLLHIGVKLKVTNQKDFGTLEIWDDRAVRVRPNTGEPCCYLGMSER